MPDSCPDPDPVLRAALHGVRGLLLDLDGVLVLKGAPVPGAVEALAELDRRAFPYVVVTNTSLMSRVALARWGRRPGSRRRRTGSRRRSRRRPGVVRRELGGRRGLRDLLRRGAGRVRGAQRGLGRGGGRGPGGGRGGRSWATRRRQLTKANLDRAFRLVLGGAAADRDAPQPVVADARGPDAGRRHVPRGPRVGDEAAGADRRQAVAGVLPGGGRPAGGRGGVPRRAPAPARRAGDGRRRRRARTSAAGTAPACARSSSAPASTATRSSRPPRPRSRRRASRRGRPVDPRGRRRAGLTQGVRTGA